MTVRLMGVVNMTPDSFSGDGLSRSVEQAVDQAVRFEVAGASIIDVGGESTRPEYKPVALVEELARVIPAIEAITSAVTVPVSVDTSKAEVAQRALEVGAVIVNDVSGLLDERLVHVVAEAEAGIILVHNRLIPPDRDVLEAVIDEMRRMIETAARAGVRQDAITIDPGFGFCKGWRENFGIIRRLPELTILDKPILVGPSRKGMIDRALGLRAGNRLDGTLALVTICIANGADMIRVHDVLEMSRAASMIDAIVTAP